MDREQFISHVKGSQRGLRRFLVALCCGDSALADDIAQETLIKAYLSCEGFGSPEKFNAWIHRIAYNTFLNHKRSERFTLDYEETATIPAGESADASFRYQHLYAALNRLPDKERTSVLLYYMEGYSIKEVAAITEVSADAVRQHLARGRVHLRGLLGSPRS